MARCLPVCGALDSRLKVRSTHRQTDSVVQPMGVEQSDPHFPHRPTADARFQRFEACGEQTAPRVCGGVQQALSSGDTCVRTGKKITHRVGAFLARRSVTMAGKDQSRAGFWRAATDSCSTAVTTRTAPSAAAGLAFGRDPSRPRPRSPHPLCESCSDDPPVDEADVAHPGDPDGLHRNVEPAWVERRTRGAMAGECVCWAA